MGPAISGQWIDDAAERIAAALAKVDPAGLFAAYEEAAPFWCPSCAASYCREHWAVWDVFDPEWPAWFEETRGLCPQGHERMIWD
jgi:hypothetical protein